MKYISRKFNCNNIFKLTDKGFTLVELLVVIIILGVLVTLAIPSITEYILDSRKKSYILTANSYISEVRTSVNSAEIQVYDPNVTYYIPRSCIKLEKGGESPYGKFSELYVAVTYDGNGYDYYFTSRDITNNGVYLTYQSLLDVDVLKSDVTAVSTSIGIGNREKILVLDDTCDVNNAKESFATSWIPERGKSTGLVGEKM